MEMNQNMKKANECLNMEDIRNEIDDIDLQTIKLIGKRSKCLCLIEI